MHRLSLPLVAAFLALVSGACTPRGYVVDPFPWLDAADWSRAERVRVELGEHALDPQVLTFQEGRPYVLDIVNTGRETHSFAAESFFRAVALREARVVGAASFETPRFPALAVRPGQNVELLLVAVRPDDYPVACTVPGHEGQGMTGALRVLPKPKAP